MIRAMQPDLEMPKEHTVKEGDCLASIAAEHGLLPDTVWQYSGNQQLRSKRKEPRVLYPGDLLQIPDMTVRKESGGTDSKHRFRRKGVPEKLNICLLLKGEPRAHVQYVLSIDGKDIEGVTDDQGGIRHAIPPGAKTAQLKIVHEEAETDHEVYDLALGHIDPIDEIEGLQARLANLGYYFGAIDGEAGPSTESAIRDFQEHEGLEPTGRIDDATRQQLESAYGA